MPQARPGLLLVLRLELGNVADQVVLDALARSGIRAISEVGDGLGEGANRLVHVDDIGLAGRGAILGIVLIDQVADQAAGFRMPVQWVNRPDQSFRGFSGLIASGRVRPGDAVRVLPSGRCSTISRASAAVAAQWTVPPARSTFAA